MEQASSGPRARYREQVRAEVQAHAWEQIADAGAAALSLKAIAKRMGMSAPALYRYFTSRDELLTELILAAYQDLAETVEGATATDDVPQHQLHEVALAVRRWAVSDPQRYLLIYGTPVPGYSAPPEATSLAHRIFTPLLAAFTGMEGRHPGAPEGPAAPGKLPARRGNASRDQRPAAAFRRSLTFWTRLHGVLSLELAGHFVGMDVDAELLYDQEVRSAIELDG